MQKERLLKLLSSRRQAARPLACKPSTCDTDGDACAESGAARLGPGPLMRN